MGMKGISTSTHTRLRTQYRCCARSAHTNERTHVYCVGVCGRTCSSVSSAVLANARICIACVWLYVCVGGWVGVCMWQRKGVCVCLRMSVCVCACARAFVCVRVRSWVRVGARAHALEQIRLSKRTPERKRSRETHWKNKKISALQHITVLQHTPATHYCKTLITYCGWNHSESYLYSLLHVKRFFFFFKNHVWVHSLLLHVEWHSIWISKLHLPGLFLTERGKRDQKKRDTRSGFENEEMFGGSIADRVA